MNRLPLAIQDVKSSTTGLELKRPEHATSVEGKSALKVRQRTLTRECAAGICGGITLDPD